MTVQDGQKVPNHYCGKKKLGKNIKSMIRYEKKGRPT